MMTRITPRFIPPTISNNSAPHAGRTPIEPMSYPADVRWRYWLLLLIGLCGLVTLGVAAIGG